MQFVNVFYACSSARKRHRFEMGNNKSIVYTAELIKWRMTQSCLTKEFHLKQTNKQANKTRWWLHCCLCHAQFRHHIFFCLLFGPELSLRGSEHLHVLFCSFFCLCVLSQTSPPLPPLPITPSLPPFPLPECVSPSFSVCSLCLCSLPWQRSANNSPEGSGRRGHDMNLSSPWLCESKSEQWK